MAAKSDKKYFKKCSNCGFKWETRDDFLMDPQIEMIGYQSNFKELTLGLFYFNHSCKGTLAIYAGLFKDLYEGLIFTSRATGTKDCPGHCLQRENFDLCPAQCECSYVREIIQLIRNFEKLSDTCTMPDPVFPRTHNAQQLCLAD